MSKMREAFHAWLVRQRMIEGVTHRETYEAGYQDAIAAAIEACEGIGEGNKWSDAHGCINAIRSLEDI